MNIIQRENRESTLIRETSHPQVKNRGETLRKIERTKERNELILTDKDYFEKMFKELEA